MNKSFDETKLISYLYGELEGQELRDFEEELARNDDLRGELEELGHTREVLGKVEDRETLEPSIIFQQSNSFRWNHWMSVAASILILMMVGYFSGLSVKVGNGELVVAFADVSEDPSNNITKEDVSDAVDQALAQYSSHFENQFQSLQSTLNNKLDGIERRNEEQFNQVAQDLAEVNQRQIVDFVSQMSRQQREEIQNLFAMSEEQQEIQMKNLLANFGAFLSEQREADLEYFQTYINSVQEETETKIYQTDQILASIISQVNNQQIAN